MFDVKLENVVIIAITVVFSRLRAILFLDHLWVALLAGVITSWMVWLDKHSLETLCRLRI